MNKVVRNQVCVGLLVGAVVVALGSAGLVWRRQAVNGTDMQKGFADHDNRALAKWISAVQRGEQSSGWSPPKVKQKTCGGLCASVAWRSIRFVL